jgi:hypothetical protein
MPITSIAKIGRVGAFDDITLAPDAVTTESTRAPSATESPFATSEKRWGLYLTEILLHRTSEFVGRYNQLYFTSIAWDLSGEEPIIYPPTNMKPSDLIIPVRTHEPHKLLGDGVLMFPPRKVVGALQLVVLVFENDQRNREWGQILTQLRKAVDESELIKLLGKISVDPNMAMAVSIAAAANALAGVIGELMTKDGDDFVSAFTGGFGTDKLQTPRAEVSETSEASIKLELTIS